jgi:hypothetical protein
MNPPVAALLVLGLAACTAQGDGNGGGAQAAGIAMRPGMWETTFRVISIDLPTAPSEIQDTLRAGISTAPVFDRDCMTPGEVADPAASLRDRTARGNPGYACERGESVSANGRIRITPTCRSTSGQPDLRQAIVGSYGADSYQVAVGGATATLATEMLPSYPVRISATLTGRRIGDCPANAAN